MQTTHVTKVIRWEGYDGNGPYNSETNEHPLFDHADTHRHPNLLNDPAVSCFNKDMFCGFISASQESNWFSAEEMQAMQSLGYRRRLFTVPLQYVRHSTKQAIFCKKEAIAVKDLAIGEEV